MELKGSEIIAECLLEQGVDTVFGYPGGAVLEIYDALYKFGKIEIVLVYASLPTCERTTSIWSS